MRPPPFVATPLPADPRYVRDQTTGLVWHRVFHRVLYADTDRSGAVYHANYLRYFEFGRATLLRDASFPYKDIESSGYIYPVIRVGLEFLYPLHYDSPMWVYTRFRELKRIRLVFDYVITHADSAKLICRGFTEHCATNLRGRPVEVDAMTRQIYQGFPK